MISDVMVVSKFKRICVFCGSSQGKKSSYQDAAIELGNELVQLLMSSWTENVLFSDFFLIWVFLQS